MHGTTIHVFLILYICCSVHHQSILLYNQHYAALSSCLYYYCEITVHVWGALPTPNLGQLITEFYV